MFKDLFPKVQVTHQHVYNSQAESKFISIFKENVAAMEISINTLKMCNGYLVLVALSLIIWSR